MGVGWGLRVEVEVLDDERTSTPTVLQGPRAVSHPTYCWPVSLDRCDRCDLLVDLEGFHLVAAARRECALVLDIDSCDRCAGYPGCGVNRSRSRARGGGGDQRALGPRSRQGSGGTIRRWICRETTCQTVTFLEHSEKVRAPRAHLNPARFAGIRVPRVDERRVAPPRPTPPGPTPGHTPH